MNGRMRRWIKELWVEMGSRSAGRRALGVDRDHFHTTRGITGMTGNSFSGAYTLLERDGGAYMRSLKKEPQLPPSLFVSERDRVRHSNAMPLVERCIEDAGSADANTVVVGEWDISELDSSR